MKTSSNGLLPTVYKETDTDLFERLLDKEFAPKVLGFAPVVAKPKRKRKKAKSKPKIKEELITYQSPSVTMQDLQNAMSDMVRFIDDRLGNRRREDYYAQRVCPICGDPRYTRHIGY